MGLHGVTSHETGLARELVRGRYTYADAARFAGASSHQVRRWLTEGSIDNDPAIADGEVTFVGLVHVIVVSWMRSRGVSMQVIRQGEARCREVWGEPRPLVTTTFRDDAARAFAGAHGRRPTIDGGTVTEALRRVLAPLHASFEYGDRVVERCWPLGRSREIVIDPMRCDGLPCIARTGVPSDEVAGLVTRGRSAERVGRDFGVTSDELDAAIEFHQRLDR